MHDEMKKPELSEVCQIEKDLISALKTVVSHGVFSKDVDTKELGELVDMVKDMAETKRNCWEACYYETVTMAMKEYDYDEDPYDIMGYNRNRNKNGRYAPNGNGDRPIYGYAPRFPYKRQMWDRMYDDPYDDLVMGYNGNRPRNGNGSYDSDRMMKDHSRDGRDRSNQYGSAFKEYEDAKRYYTETKSLEDKSRMEEKALEHVNQSMMTLREIWKNADPEVKKEVSASVASLASEFKNA